ncbi:MAG: nuclear transport factor 2 family protein [Flavitalea sp.]
MIKYSFLLVALVNIWLIAPAQTKDEMSLSALIDNLNVAIIKADKNALEQIVSDQLSYGHSSGKVEDKTQFIETVLNGPLKFSSIDLTDKTISMAGKNAIARNSFMGKAMVNGEAKDIKLQVLMVWQKIKGHWKLLARQGFKI